MHWLRWYHGTTNDSKLRRIAQQSNTTVANVIAVWASLLESASECVERGSVHRWSVDDTGFTLGIPEEVVAQIYAAMQGKVLSGQQVTHWTDRQPKREKPDPTPADGPMPGTEHIGAHEHTSEHIGADRNESGLEERRGEESIKKTTTKSSSPTAPKPKVVKSESKYPHYPTELCDRLFETYKTNRGAIDYGRFRKETAPLFPTNYSPDVLIHAMEAWLEYVEGVGPDKARFEKLPGWVESITRWARIGELPLVDVNGVTERGRLCCGIAA